MTATTQTRSDASAPATVLLDRLSKHFKSPEGAIIKAVDDITLELAGGSFVTLLGPSGCGKTTTLRMIAGFEVPTTGRIMVDDKDIARSTPDKRGMGMVFQSYALFPHLTVHDNVAFGVQLQGKKGKELEQTIENSLDLVNLHGLGARKISELSGGQQQRVALARAMAIEPRVLLFDEPLSNLDAKLRVSLRSEIRRIQRALGTTSVYVTHDQAEAMALSDVVVVMNAGQIEQAGPPDEVYRRPASRFVADFIGRANFLKGEVQAVAAETIDIELLDVTMSIAAGSGHTTGGTAVVVARPESVRVGEGDLRAKVKGSTFLGSYVEYELELGGGQDDMLAVDVEWMSHGIRQPGEDIAWTLVPERAYALPAGAEHEQAAAE